MNLIKGSQQLLTNLSPFGNVGPTQVAQEAPDFALGQRLDQKDVELQAAFVEAGREQRFRVGSDQILLLRVLLHKSLEMLPSRVAFPLGQMLAAVHQNAQGQVAL